MSAQVRPALQSDADAVAVFLNRHMNAKIPVERWRRLFYLPWSTPADASDYGRVAISRGEVVGFAGRIFSERIIDGRPELIGNLNSWYMRKDHRKGRVGLKVHYELLENRGRATLMTFSIAERTKAIYDRWGFAMLDRYRWLWHRNPAAPADTIEVVTDRAAIEREVDANQQQMLHDHRDADVWPALIRSSAGDCLAVLTSKRKQHDVLFLDVLHLSRPDIFESSAMQVANLLLEDDQSVVAVDSRFLSETPPGAERVTIPVPRRYISDTLEPRSIDHLYSELVLLNLKLS